MARSLRSLYICYLSLDDPLVHTQVVAYLEGLVRRGHVLHLLTFDPKLAKEREASLREELAGRGIQWHSLRYHKTPSLPATIYDTVVGAVVAARLVRRYRLDAVHARNHVPAAMALMVRRLTRCRLIFDIRGLMAEEYADAGRWKRGGFPYRLTEWVQRTAIRRASGVVMLTEAVKRHLFGQPPSRDTLEVIPCCADLDGIEGLARERAAVRRDLGIDDRPVMAYVGKFTGRYMERQMVEFFSVARSVRPGLLFLVLTQIERGVIVREFEQLGIAASDYVVTSARPDEVGRYLSAADFAVCFYHPRFSEIAASPTKFGEYFAAGLPVVSSRGIGDSDAILSENRVGVLIDRFGQAAYEAAAREILKLVDDAHCAERCRSVARRHLSLRDVGIPRYDSLYRRVAVASGG
jgi:glycosyltransferase involved in cell wall biosynthesis